MGKTSFKGPVFGAKGLLWSYQKETVAASTAIQTLASIDVPDGEDWFITRVDALRGSTHSTAFVLTLVDDSTSIATVAITSSAANSTGSTTLTPDSGEYMGVKVESGSSLALRLTIGTSSAASSGIHCWVYGYQRFNSTASTRTE